MYDNKNVLITGGTGYFGQKFTQHLLKNYKPNKIIIFSRDEYKQYKMQNEFNSNVMRYFIGDVRDYERMSNAFRNVDILVHAAALKHVPIAEYNPMECGKTNIFGAINVVNAALFNSVPQIIALSTDKAANPVNLYGATKLTSDKIFLSANNDTGGQVSRFAVVRYGNVANSRGSVIPFFSSLLKIRLRNSSYSPRNDKVLITIEEGISFVDQCLSLMRGGELFVPKIPSFKILDLVKAMTKNNEHEVVGIRPGEKLHEIMCPKENAQHTIEFAKYFIIKPTIEFRNSIGDYDISKVGEKIKKGRYKF